MYSLVPAESLSHEGRWLAALMGAGEGGALSHPSAAALFDLIRWQPRLIHVTIPRYRRNLDGVRVHESRRLDPRDVTTHRGIPVTTVERTLEAIELWLAGSAGLKSRLERAFLGLVIDAGLSKPIPNIHVAGAEADAWWPDLRLVAEVDGPNHTRPPSLRADGSRDRLLAEAGVTVLRFTEFEVERRHEDVLAALVRAGCR